MRIRWRARDYERTCLSCGCVWQVPRGVARPHMRGMPMGGPRVRGMPVSGSGVGTRADDVIASNAALGEQAAALKQCPHCGSTRYRQKLIWS